MNVFPRNSVVVIDGVTYKPQSPLAGRLIFMDSSGAFFVTPDENGVVGPPTEDQWEELLLAGRAVVTTATSGDPARLLAETSQETIAQVRQVDSGVDKMLAQVEMLDEAGVPQGDKAIEAHLAKHWTGELADKFGPYTPARTIRRYRAKRGSPGRRHARDMMRRNGRVPRGPYMADVPAEILWKHAYAHWSHKARFADTYAAYRAEMKEINEGRHPDYAKPPLGYTVASEDTMRRRCNALESSHTDAVRNGLEKLKQDWLGGGRPLEADFPMQRVIIDHTRVDVHVVDDEREMVLGRAWLTIAICVRTRAIVGHLLTFFSPSVLTVTQILRRIVLPKRPPGEMVRRYPILKRLRGKPVELIVDNATEFRSETLEAACRAVGIHVRFCPIKQPRYRAVCERAIGTVNRMLCELLPGRVLPKAEASRLGSDPEAEACIIMDELEALLNQVVAEYNTAPHEGLGQRQPALVFQRGVAGTGIVNVADFDGLMRDLMAVEPDVQISPGGVRLWGLRYHCIRGVRDLLDDLVALECRRKRRDDATATADVRYDPADIGEIHVWNRRTKRYVTLRCSDPVYAVGLPLAFHLDLQKAARAEGLAFNTPEERLEVRARRIQAIRNIDPKAKAKARKAVADLYEISRLRAISGAIVHLQPPAADDADVAEFIPSDRAAPTALDQEILSSRSQKARRRTEDDDVPRDRRDAGRRDPSQQQGSKRRRGATGIEGEYA